MLVASGDRIEAVGIQRQIEATNEQTGLSVETDRSFVPRLLHEHPAVISPRLEGEAFRGL